MDIGMQYSNKFHFDNVYFTNPIIYEDILLYQVGDRYIEQNVQINMHKQVCYEISYIESGSGYFYIDGIKYDANKGDVFVCLPGEEHQISSGSNNHLRYYYLGFLFNTQNNILNKFYHIEKMFSQLKDYKRTNVNNIADPFINIFNELINTNNLTDIMINTFLKQIIITTYRRFFSDLKDMYTKEGHITDTQKLIYCIISYIDTNLLQINKLTEISETLNYNYSYLSRVFQSETELTIKDYYNNKRFQKAVELIKSTDMSITEISDLLRYKSVYSFSRAFRQQFGISPSEYRVENDKKMITTRSINVKDTICEQ